MTFVTSKFRPCALLSGALAALSLTLTLTSPTMAHDPVTIQGQVVNGSQSAGPVAQAQVSFHAFDPEGGLEIQTTATDAEGRFSFSGIHSDDSQLIVVSTVYEEVTYSQDVSPALTETPLTLEVFDLTREISSLNTDSHIWMLRDVDKENRAVAALEIVLITNNQNQTFSPNLDQSQAMSFLRFSLPEGAATLEVQSDLQGGDVIDVGTGFALTAPVLPGTHQLAFTYQYPYTNDAADLSLAFHQGADVFRILIPIGMGKAQGLQLEEMDSTLIGDIRYRVWEARDLSVSASLAVQLSGLPQPSLWQRFSNQVEEGRVLQIGIPSSLGLGLLALFAYGLFYRKRPLPLAATPGGPPPRPALAMPQEKLLREVAQLDDLFAAGGLPEANYINQRNSLKDRLLKDMASRGPSPSEESQ